MNSIRKKIVLSASSKAFLDSRRHLINRMIEQGHEVFCLVPDGLSPDPTKEYGAFFYSLPLQKSNLSPLQDLIFLKNFFRLLQKIKPDILLGYTIKPVIYGSLAARMCGIREVYSIIAGLGYAFVNQTCHQKTAGFFASRLYQLALKNNRRVLFQNPDDLNDFIKMGLLKKSQALTVNGSGVDLAHFSFSPPPDTNPVKFTMIARIMKEKGVFEFIEAAKILQQEFSQAQFQIIGPLEPPPCGISAAQLKSMLENSHVDYLSAVDDVRPWLSCCSVFVLPTYYREGVPRIILEALSTGRAIITTDTPGCRETVIHDHNGFLISPRNIGMLVENMRKFLTSPQLIEKFGKNSRRIAEEKFNVHQINELIMRELRLI